jgi:hypothetical protein
MPTIHQFPYLARAADACKRSDPDRALRAEISSAGLALATIADQCAAVRELRVIPVLQTSENADPVWAAASWERHPIWLRIMSAVCTEPSCKHSSPEIQAQARQQAWEAASPRLRRLRARAGRDRRRRVKQVATRGRSNGVRWAVARLNNASAAVRSLTPDRFA